jgi:hypothetical protein
MGQKSSREREIQNSIEAAGHRFTKASNKSLRLYFQSQFHSEMEEEDFKFLFHIFEIKVYLFFQRHYDKKNLINTLDFLNETYELNVNTIFEELRNLEIIQNDNYEVDEIFTDYFDFCYKNSCTQSYNICVINYYLRNLTEINPCINLSSELKSQIEMTTQLEIYTLLNNNTNIVYFILKRIFELCKPKIKKITIFQVGLRTIDELLYTILAHYIRSNPEIESVCIIEKTSKGLKHIELPFDEDMYLNEERLENPLINRQHFFNFYQSLAAKNNLIELRILFFINDYNFVMLSQVLLLNKNLKILQVRNVSNKEMKNRELDFGFNEFSQMGENLRDEVFIFFNYLVQLNYLEELHLTHFWFNSEINSLACETAKSMKGLRILSLDKNQAIIANDNMAAQNFNFEKTNLVKLNMGYSYLNMIRNYETIIHPDKLKEVNIGVLDFCSFSAFVKYIPHTSLERVSLTLNKPLNFDSIPILFKQISNKPFQARNLKYFYILNSYTNKVYKEIFKSKYLVELIENMKKNQTIRKLSFRKPCISYTSLKESENDKLNGFRVFRYINKRDYNSCAVLILTLKMLFKYENYPKYCFELHKDVFFNKIIKNVLHFRFANFRKIELE